MSFTLKFCPFGLGVTVRERPLTGLGEVNVEQAFCVTVLCLTCCSFGLGKANVELVLCVTVLCLTCCSCSFFIFSSFFFFGGGILQNLCFFLWILLPYFLVHFGFYLHCLLFFVLFDHEWKQSYLRCHPSPCH